MTDTITPLVLDLLEWIAVRHRPYSEVMEAWRTSCPRLTIWEEANDRGFLVQRRAADGDNLVELTILGRNFLKANGRSGSARESRETSRS
jgi:hypothetical protein